MVVAVVAHIWIDMSAIEDQFENELAKSFLASRSVDICVNILIIE